MELSVGKHLITTTTRHSSTLCATLTALYIFISKISFFPVFCTIGTSLAGVIITCRAGRRSRNTVVDFWSTRLCVSCDQLSEADARTTRVRCRLSAHQHRRWSLLHSGSEPHATTSLGPSTLMRLTVAIPRSIANNARPHDNKSSSIPHNQLIFRFTGEKKYSPHSAQSNTLSISTIA